MNVSVFDKNKQTSKDISKKLGPSVAKFCAGGPGQKHVDVHPCRLDDGEEKPSLPSPRSAGGTGWGIQSESSKVVEEISTMVPRNCCPEELRQLYSAGPRATETNSSGIFANSKFGGFDSWAWQGASLPSQ